MILIKLHQEVLLQYYRDQPALNNGSAIVDLNDNNATDSLKFKEKTTGQAGTYGTKNVKIPLPLNYLSNFWRILEMPQISCKNNLMLNWSMIGLYHLELLQMEQQYLQ